MFARCPKWAVLETRGKVPQHLLLGNRQRSERIVRLHALVGPQINHETEYSFFLPKGLKSLFLLIYQDLK